MEDSVTLPNQNINRISSFSFEKGIPLAVYKRLLPTALDKVFEKFTADEAEKIELGEIVGRGISLPESKTFVIWRAQQKKGTKLVSELMSMDGEEGLKRHGNFNKNKNKYGEAALEAMFRIDEDGQVFPGKAAGEVTGAEDVAFIYSIFSLAIGAGEEERTKLAEIMADKFTE